jgi:hypothetical protein
VLFRHLFYFHRKIVNDRNNDGVDRNIFPLQHLLRPGSLLKSQDGVTDSGINLIDRNGIPADWLPVKVDWLNDEELVLFEAWGLLCGYKRSGYFAEVHRGRCARWMESRAGAYKAFGGRSMGAMEQNND